MGVCNGRMQWAYAMGVCNGRMQWAYAMGVCNGRMQWAYAIRPYGSYHTLQAHIYPIIK